MNDGNSKPVNTDPAQNPEAALEMTYIHAYLREKGYSNTDLDKLPEKQAARLRRGASRYASLKLAELESRARLHSKIHNAVHSR
jgi:hypothetical protein